MVFTFRAKLLLVVAATAVAFALLIGLGALIDRREEGQLAHLQDRLLPRMALGPQLEADLHRVRQAVQDAVAAQDLEELDRTRAMLAAFFRRLADAGGSLDAGDVAALRGAVDDYYNNALAVARRLIAGETGEAVTEAIAAMQAKQNAAHAALERTVRLDRRELVTRFVQMRDGRVSAARNRVIIGVGCLLFALVVTIWLSAGTLRVLRELSAGLSRFGAGDFSRPVEVRNQDEFGQLARAANLMADSLSKLNQERDLREWLTRGQARLADQLRGELRPAEVGARATRFLASYLGAPAAALYVSDSRGDLALLGDHALGPGDSGDGAGVGGTGAGATITFRRGEGLIGQASLADELVLVNDLPPDYLHIRSGLGGQSPKALLLLPLTRGAIPGAGAPLTPGEGTVGVLELALFNEPNASQRELLMSIRETLAIALAVAQARVAMQTLLAETQRQAELLASQEEELRSNNEELQSQQEELTQSNQEMEQQQRVLERQNKSLEEARARLSQKAEELATVSTYKSRFLANMSHELRTPLNSMLILSNLLARNESGNLSEKQVEYCKTVHSAGRDLLALINQVLDLAKIEAGKQDVTLAPLVMSDLLDFTRRLFQPVAAEKGIALELDVAAEVPPSIITDQRRVEQILINLVGNALKFTQRGSVSLRVRRAQAEARLRRPGLRPEEMVAIAVTDTGVGIASEDQDRIFSPFEQAEARSDRRFGGTGLGLTIARELAALLGGELQVDSTVGVGSTFTLFLPLQPPAAQPVVREPVAAVASRGIVRRPGVLLVEDDTERGESLVRLLASEGFETIHVGTAADALSALANQRFGCMILDLGLPDMDGFGLLETLERSPELQAPPVLIHTGRSLSRQEVQRLQAHAHAVVLKEGRSIERLVEEVRLFVQNLDGSPVEPVVPARVTAQDVPLAGAKLLVADDDMRTVYALEALLRSKGAEVLVADTGQSTLDTLRRHPDVQAVVTDLMMPDMDGYEAIRRIRAQPQLARLPIVALSAKLMKGEQERCLDAGASAYLPKPVDSEALLSVLKRELQGG